MKNRTIRLATMTDLPDLLRIYAQARRYMIVMGNPTQWGDYYPEAAITQNDIAQGECYVVEENSTQQLLGVFVWRQGEYAPYTTIHHGRWLNDAPYGVLLRLASSGQGGGIADEVLQWLIAHDKDIRVDTHRDNTPMRNALMRHAFRLCGMVELEAGKQRIAFHWHKPKAIRSQEEQAQRAAQNLAFLEEKAARLKHYKFPQPQQPCEANSPTPNALPQANEAHKPSLHVVRAIRKG